MYYTIYKTTCLLNGKFYIGKHQTKNLDDGYFGSGKLLIRAVKKHGIENFATEIIAVYKTEHEMNLAEKILVVVDPDISYNLCSGGMGGFSYINKFPELRNSPKQRKAASNSFFKFNQNITPEQIAYRRSKRAPAFKAWRKANPTPLKIMQKMRIAAQSPEARHKRKESFSKIEHQKGAKNSNFGTIWITNGSINKKINKKDPIPDGWKTGRVL